MREMKITVPRNKKGGPRPPFRYPRSTDVCADLPLGARLGQLLLVSLAGAGQVPQHIAAAPNGLDVVLAAGRGCQLLAELADEDVDDLQLRLVHPAIEMIEEHLLGERRALAEREQLQDRVLLAGEVQGLAGDLNRAGVEIDRELAGLDDRFRVALGPADDRLDPRDQFATVERLGQIVVGAEAQPLELAV